MTLSDHGNASIGVMSLAAVVMVLSMALADLGIYLLGRSRAQTAADAAALAAAAELIPGPGRDPEELARRFARLNGGTLEQCSCRQGSRDAIVAVSVPVRLTILRLTGVRNARAVAKADVQLSRGSGGKHEVRTPGEMEVQPEELDPAHEVNR